MYAYCRTLIECCIGAGALRSALMVGMLLNLINHGGQMMNGFVIERERPCLNVLVPYCVAYYSVAKSGIRRNRNE